MVLAEKPSATYDGGTPGLAATKPVSGKKLDANRPEVKQYKSHLEQKQAQLAGQQGVKIQRQFTAALNGFSAKLTADQAVKLAKDPVVLLVAPDTENAPDYSTTDFLKLSGPNGTWNTKFGGQDAAGKGVVVGVIDTGYTPSSAYFAGQEVKPLTGDPVVGVPYRTPDGKIKMLKADGEDFKGECQAGTDFDGTACNSKVLSARYFGDDFAATVPSEWAPGERLSPVDAASHGTHTASTAAGNANVEAMVDGRSFGQTSGIAPAAKLSVYKVCWEDNDPNTGGCYSSASIEAINQAIQDGVDVLNYSISGATDTTTDPVSLAFLSAASAGIFVAVSAGNSGPTASTVNHGAPWLTTVAATSFSQELQGTVEFSDGSKYRGASIMNGQVSNAGVVLAANAASRRKRQPGPVRPRFAGPGQDRRQGCGLRPRRRGPRRKERRGQARRRRRHDPRQPDRLLAGHGQALGPHRPREPARHRGHQGQGRRQPGHHGFPGQQGHHRTAPRGAAADRRVLLPRPAARCRLRSPEARRRGARCGRAGRRFADRHRRRQLRFPFRHLHGVPACGRLRRADPGQEAHVVPGDGQVRDDDHHERCQERRRFQEHRCLCHRRRPGGPGPRAGSGPRLRRHHGGLPGVRPARSSSRGSAPSSRGT